MIDNTAKPMAPASYIEGEGENRLRQLKARYSPVKNLLKRHKDLIKTIKSLEQGRNGKEVACVFCKYVGPIDKMQLNHINGNKFDHRLENLEPCDQSCNNGDHARRLIDHIGITDKLSSKQESEAAHSASTQTGASEILLPKLEYNSREGAKHEIMRPRYDTWIRDQNNGPFADRHSWPKDLLSEAAPYACSTDPGKAFGSSKTYVKFINEDIAGGILKSEVAEGVINVYLNKDYLTSIREKTGQ